MALIGRGCQVMLCQLRAIAFALIGAGLLSLQAVPALAQQKNADRNVHCGETHLHTSWSFDAFAFGTAVAGPEDLPRFPTRRSAIT